MPIVKGRKWRLFYLYIHKKKRSCAYVSDFKTLWYIICRPDYVVVGLGWNSTPKIKPHLLTASDSTAMLCNLFCSLQQLVPNSAVNNISVLKNSCLHGKGVYSGVRITVTTDQSI